MKKRGFGEGKWNGFGGKIESGETIEEATQREMHEETELIIKITTSDKAAILTFTFAEPKEILEVHVYVVHTYKGDLQETDEMYPSWFTFSDIPYNNMWEPDVQWLPKVLGGSKVIGRYSFDRNNHVIDSELHEVETL